MRLKSWETPRSGPRRNSKSRQASAKLRQIKKRNQQLRNKLKANAKEGNAQAGTPRTPQNTPTIAVGVFFCKPCASMELPFA
jgi:hypothetical protein